MNECFQISTGPSNVLLMPGWEWSGSSHYLQSALMVVRLTQPLTAKSVVVVDPLLPDYWGESAASFSRQSSSRAATPEGSHSKVLTLPSRGGTVSTNRERRKARHWRSNQLLWTDGVHQPQRQFI